MTEAQRKRWESEDYDPLDVEETETETLVTIRGKKYGGKGVMHIPHHTPEEMQAIIDNVIDVVAKFYGDDPNHLTLIA